MLTNCTKTALILAACGGAILSGGVARAAAIANFTDGNGTSSGDSFVGVAGSGWTGAWGNTLSNAPTVNNTVVNTTPLGTGDNYLSMNMTGSATNATSTQNVYRTFAVSAGNVDNTQPIEIKFDFRLDSAATSRSQTDSLDKISFIDNNALGSSATQTWTINSQGSSTSGNNHFTFGNGDRAGASSGIDTGISVVTGTVYSFDILIHPGATVAATSWDASVTDGTNTFTQTGMGFRSATALTSSGRLQFFSSVNSKNEVLGYSVDSLSVANTPEPASLGILAAVGTSVLGRRRRRAD